MEHGAHSPNGATLPPQLNSPRALPNIAGLGGALAGLGGGLAMMIVAALLSLGLGHDMWLEPRQIAAPLFGGVQNSMGALLAGTVLHFAIAALLGAAFGIVARRVLHLPSDYGVPVVAGLLYGLALWVLAYFVVLPVANPALLETYAPSFLIQHLVYGMVTGLLYSQLRPAPYATSSRLAVANRA